MDPRSKVLQKPIYQAIFKIWGAESSFINTGICISLKIKLAAGPTSWLCADRPPSILWRQLVPNCAI